MKRKGFTLVELLVVIAIIALLMGILMPALAQVRRLAQRIMCGTNLSAIGKSMTVYSNDNDEDFPRAGGRKSRWAFSTKGKIAVWDYLQVGDENPEPKAFGAPVEAPATITSCFYLLIKYTDGTPKIFICKGDIGSAVFKLSDSTSTEATNLADVWDFGDGSNGTLWPGEYVSYSYHMPFSHTNQSKTLVSYALTSASSSASPLGADRNPYIDRNAAEVYVDRYNTEDSWSSWDNKTGFYDGDHVRNAAAHQRDGQNVLYVDTHVEFEKTPNCGIENDYIWICWQNAPNAMEKGDKEWGQQNCRTILSKAKIGYGKLGPANEDDAFLVNEYNGTP